MKPSAKLTLTQIPLPLSGTALAEVRVTHLCLMSGMLMQLAAATAAKGTKRPMSGDTCCGRERPNALPGCPCTPEGPHWLLLESCGKCRPYLCRNSGRGALTAGFLAAVLYFQLGRLRHCGSLVWLLEKGSEPQSPEVRCGLVPVLQGVAGGPLPAASGGLLGWGSI